MRRYAVLFATLSSVWLLAGPTAAQEMPKPGKEHALLKNWEGTWDCNVKLEGMGDSKGTCTYKMDLGGFFLCGEFTGDFGGMQFKGRSLSGFDPLKKKYVSTWADSMSPHVMMLEGAYDASGKVFTELGDSVGMDGKPAKIKNVTEMTDKDTFIMKMFEVKDGKDKLTMTIEYKRKK